MNEVTTNQNATPDVAPSTEMANATNHDEIVENMSQETPEEKETNESTSETLKASKKSSRSANPNTNIPDEAVNEVVLQGKIVHKFATDKTTILTISTGRATLVPNHPKVVFFGDVKDEAAKYEVGEFVHVIGNIQSSKRNPKIKNQSTLSVFGESIEAAKTQFEQDFGVPGKYAPVINHFKIAGRISAIDIPSKNVVRITVVCPKNGRISFVTVSHFAKDPAKVIADHLPGSFVRVYGNVSTSKVVKGKDTRYYQSYIASELN